MSPSAAPWCSRKCSDIGNAEPAGRYVDCGAGWMVCLHAQATGGSTSCLACCRRPGQPLKIVEERARPLVDVILDDLASHEPHSPGLVLQRIVHRVHQAILEAIDVVRIDQVRLAQL